MKRLSKAIACLALCATTLAGCVSPDGDTRDQQYASAMRMHDDVLETATKKWPELQAEIDGSVGYAVFDTGVLKIFIIGTANGYGVVVDNASGVRTIVDNFAIELGPGIELSNTNGIIVFHTKEAFDAAMDPESGWEFGGSAMLGLEFGDFGGDIGATSVGGETSSYRNMENGIGIHASIFWLDSDRDEDLN